MEEPFDSIRKMMSTINEIPEDERKGQEQDHILFSKGAPEVILQRCTHIYKNGRITGLSDQDKQSINNNNTSLAKKAMRNLAFAFKYVDKLPDEERLKKEESGLVYLGMVGMIDPPRPEVYDAIQRCRNANIKVIMVTGILSMV